MELRDKKVASRPASGINRDPTVGRTGAGLGYSPALRPERPVVPTGILVEPPDYRPGVSLVRAGFRLVSTVHPPRAPMLSQSPPLFVRAAQSHPQGAASTKAS
jgi:hypothetical protein